jgi:bifunctional DNA-binding transcriptional regulator/antitoxin component of YhaV-PrlF toxin-antitoxin module
MRHRPGTRISSKHQITIPVQALRAAGLNVGDRLIVHVEGSGRLVCERAGDVLDKYAGVLTGVYEPDELERLRNEWD